MLKDYGKVIAANLKAIAYISAMSCHFITTKKPRSYGISCNHAVFHVQAADGNRTRPKAPGKR